MTKIDMKYSNLKEVMDKLHSLLDDCEKAGMGAEEIAKFCDCIDALADISHQIRAIGLALKEYGVEMNGIAFERRKGGGFQKSIGRLRTKVYNKKIRGLLDNGENQ